MAPAPLDIQLASPPAAPLVGAGRRGARRGFPRTWTLTLSGLGVLLLTLYVHTVLQEHHLNALKKEIDGLREQTIRDRMQLEAVRNPQVIDSKAVKLGMKQPAEVVYVNKPLASKRRVVNAIPLRQTVTHEGF
ncbi:MAG: hypothetical protein VKQ33_07335 [Candidatus Sericytochromatia bacterium]|nr:hypothetical protein [Candidatus Sericytochromatia bacterium]